MKAVVENEKLIGFVIETVDKDITDINALKVLAKSEGIIWLPVFNRLLELSENKAIGELITLSDIDKEIIVKCLFKDLNEHIQSSYIPSKTYEEHIEDLLDYASEWLKEEPYIREHIANVLKEILEPYTYGYKITMRFYGNYHFLTIILKWKENMYDEKWYDNYKMQTILEKLHLIPIANLYLENANQSTIRTCISLHPEEIDMKDMQWEFFNSVLHIEKGVTM